MSGTAAGIALAKAAFAWGDLAKAEALCRSVIDAGDGASDPWIILADVALRRGRGDEALGHADRAIAAAPGDRHAHVVRCKALMACSRASDAVDALERAVAVDGASAAMIDSYGLLFSRLLRFARAREMFALAVRMSPDAPAFRYNLAVSDRTFGNLAAAEANLDRVIAADPARSDAYLMRSGLRTQTPSRNHVDEIEARLAQGSTRRTGVVALRYALGKEYDDLQRHAEAFAQIKAGADLVRLDLSSSVDSQVAVIDFVTAQHGGEALRRAAAAGARKRFPMDDPIFIVGLPRSGTTLVERIVAQSAEIVAGGELGVLPSQLTLASKRAGATAEGRWAAHLGALDLAALGRAYVRIAADLAGAAGRRFTDKYPPNLLFAGVITAALPRAKIVAVHRKPMDACWALYKSLFNTGVYPYSYSLDDVAQYYAASRRLSQHWENVLPDVRYLQVSYEALVADPQVQGRRIADFLGLRWNPAMLDFHADGSAATTASAVQIRRPLYATAVGGWRSYEDHLHPLRAALRRLMPTEALD